MTTDTSVAREDLEYLLQYAQDDWIGLSTLVSKSGKTLGEEATWEEVADLMLDSISRLIDFGAIPGDLTEEGDLTFIPWRGAKQERLERIRIEIRNLGRLPYTGEVCWIHKPGD